MSKITLRKKSLVSGMISLYLDYYPGLPDPKTGKPVRREYLKLYLYAKPRTENERNLNRETQTLAENIRAKRLLEIQNEEYGFLTPDRLLGSFLDFYRTIATKKNGTTCGAWYMSYRYLKSFSGETLRFSDITPLFCDNYRAYLLKSPSLGSHDVKISNNTALAYYNRFRAVIKDAYRASLLKEDIFAKTQSIKEQETHREFLTIEEFQTLAKTDMKPAISKRAAIFSGLTGLRFSDIKGLIWDEVRGDPGDYYLQFSQKKTKGAEVLPISDQTRSLLGEKANKDAKVFRGLEYSATRTFLVKWLAKARIDKEITFHSFRHTYATLQLAGGTDIFTVSKLLGHKNVKTTQIYTKIVDSKKKEATTRIVIDL